ncbi:MAG TPA: hypothetical protein VF507_08800 [Pyrinomonadaceae bacterium]|jgi:hypothetical protein
MLRATALSLVLLVSAAVVLPLVGTDAYNKRPAVSRRHSRAWWRRHRARLRRKRLASNNNRRRRENASSGNSSELAYTSSPATDKRADAHKESAPPAFNVVRGVFRLALPSGWAGRAVGGEARYRAFAPDGRPAGDAAVSFLPSSYAGNPGGLMALKNQRRMIGGVSENELRRIVINKMVASGGWVVNDLEREMTGRKVYVVLAQTAGEGGAAPESRVFYFTEVEGRVLSIVTSTPLEFAERMAAEAEKMMASL